MKRFGLVPSQPSSEATYADASRSRANADADRYEVRQAEGAPPGYVTIATGDELRRRATARRDQERAEAMRVWSSVLIALIVAVAWRSDHLVSAQFGAWLALGIALGWPAWARSPESRAQRRRTLRHGFVAFACLLGIGVATEILGIGSLLRAADPEALSWNWPP